MNGIEKIIQRIDGDMNAQVDQMLGTAREEAEKITSRYQAQAAQERESLAEENAKAASEREERLVSVAQLEARKTLLSVKQEMVEQTFEKALEKLCSLPDESYIRTAAKLLSQAADDEKGSVIFSAKDRERIGSAAVQKANELLGEKGALTLSDETRDIKGGFILVTGRVEFNCTFDTLIRLQRAECSAEAAHRLFPNG